jgi:hypothetical protein
MLLRPPRYVMHRSAPEAQGCSVMPLENLLGVVEGY